MSKSTDIRRMVQRLAECTGIPYQTEYASHYGGWNLFYIPAGESYHARGKYGFDFRKSSDEMLAYLEGILIAIG